MAEDELLTVDEVAGRVKVNPETVRRWIKSGRLSAVKAAGGPYRIHSEDLDRLFGVVPKAEASPPVEADEERRTNDYESVAGAVEVFCDDWEGPLDRGDLDSLKEYRAQATGMTRILDPVWDMEFKQLRGERGKDVSMFDTTLFPSIDRFMALGLRYDALLAEQEASGAPVPDELAKMREKFEQRKKAG